MQSVGKSITKSNNDTYCYYPPDCVGSHKKRRRCRKCSNLQDFCSNVDYIKGNDPSGACSVISDGGKLTTAQFEKVAAKYCNKNQNDEWCQCYNITEQRCMSNPGIPGCEDVSAKLETLQEQLHPKYWAAFEGTEKCWGNCAKANIFKPKNAIVPGGVCSKPVTLCISTIDAGNLKDSAINVTQNCGNDEKRFNADGEEVDTMGVVIPGGSKEDPANVPTNKTNVGSKFTTTKVDDIRNQRLYEKREIQAGSLVVSSMSTCIISMFMIMMMFM